MSNAKIKRMALIRQQDMSSQILDKDRYTAIGVVVDNLLESLIDYTPSPNITWRAHVCNLRNILSNTIIILDNIK